jgi:hypothetical protein
VEIGTPSEKLGIVGNERHGFGWKKSEILQLQVSVFRV